MNKLSFSKMLPARSEQKMLARQEDFNRKVAALRRATGKMETRNAPFLCAVAGKGFIVRFERSDPARRFKVAAVNRVESAVNVSTAPANPGPNRPAAATFDVGEFDLAGWTCPWCGDSCWFIHCSSCDHVVCAGRGRIEEDGTQSFRCHDRCGSSGVTVPYGMMHAQKQSAGAGGPARKTLPGPRKPALPGTDRASLLLWNQHNNR